MSKYKKKMVRDIILGKGEYVIVVYLKLAYPFAKGECASPYSTIGETERKREGKKERREEERERCFDSSEMYVTRKDEASSLARPSCIPQSIAYDLHFIRNVVSLCLFCCGIRPFLSFC